MLIFKKAPKEGRILVDADQDTRRVSMPKIELTPCSSKRGSRLFFRSDEEISLLAWREPYRNEKIFHQGLLFGGRRAFWN